MAQGHFSLKESLLNWVPSHKQEHTLLCQGRAGPQPLPSAISSGAGCQQELETIHCCMVCTHCDQDLEFNLHSWLKRTPAMDTSC